MRLGLVPYAEAGAVPVPDEASYRGDPHSLRLIIQQVQGTTGTAYRLVAYGDRDHYCTPEFPTVAAVLTLLHRAIPEVDTSGIAEERATTSIIFARDVVLTNEQRMKLGLLQISR